MSIDERARLPSLVSSARPPLSAHRPGATVVRRAMRRSSAACRRTAMTGALTACAYARRRVSIAARNAAGLAYSRMAAGLVNRPRDQPPHALGAIPGGPPQLVGRDEPVLHGATHGFEDDAGIGARVGGINDGAGRRADADPEPGHDFARAKRPRGGVDLHSRPARLPLGRPVGARDGEVNLARPDRREIVQCQRRFVRHDGAGRARLEPGRDDVLMGLSGKLDESIESATLALEVLGPDMVPECPTIVADGVRLGRGEVSTLCGGEVEELAPSLKPCWHGHSGEYVVNWSYFIRLIHDIARGGGPTLSRYLPSAEARDKAMLGPSAREASPAVLSRPAPSATRETRPGCWGSRERSRGSPR